jgi:hypothetical protein
MSDHPLDNPIWQSLAHRHRELALAHGEVLRYPVDIAPFLGVPGPHVPLAPAIETLIPPGDTVLLLGAVPPEPAGWTLKPLGELAQMVCEAPMAEVDGPDFIELGETQRADVLALTALVYPHYFRPHTMELGRYFGMYVDGQLAAIIGERMGPPGWREISAVCTHPPRAGPHALPAREPAEHPCALDVREQRLSDPHRHRLLGAGAELIPDLPTLDARVRGSIAELVSCG